MPAQTFALDVCYKSDVTTLFTPNANNPISMAYGFVQIVNGGFIERGAIVDLSIDAGDSVKFSFLDIAANPAPISSIVISCNDVTPPNNPNNPIKNVSPFGWTNGTYTVPTTQLTSTSSFGSSGCNMNGHGLTIGPFTAQAAPGNRNKTYDITITITVNMPDGSTRVFQVDPEIDVEGAG